MLVLIICIFIQISCMSFRFLNCVQLFLQLDSGTPQGMTQQVTHKVTQHLTGASCCENIKLLNSVIQVGLIAEFLFFISPLAIPKLGHSKKS